MLDRERSPREQQPEFDKGRRGVLKAIAIVAGLALAVPGAIVAIRQLMAQNGSTTSPEPPALQTPVVLSDSLKRLGFMEITVGGEQIFIPPVRDIPSGPFVMGSNTTDPHANPDEIPQTSITVNGFKIGTVDVTVAEYSRATSAQAVKEPSTLDDLPWQKQLEHLDYPVVGVSWDECVAYAKWLASKTGKPWRLPTEAEWEKAARGNDRRIYPFGNDWDPKKANTNESSIGHPAPVGTYPDSNEVSPYGVQDMAGNVGEWTSSLYRRYPYNATDGRENPNAPLDTPNTPNSRVFRGGSFNSAKEFARTASRSNGSPISHRRDVGFRLAQG